MRLAALATIRPEPAGLSGDVLALSSGRLGGMGRAASRAGVYAVSAAATQRDGENTDVRTPWALTPKDGSVRSMRWQSADGVCLR